MNYEVIHLRDVSMQDLCTCFNLAFSDYFVKFQVDETYLTNRFKAASVQYQLSYGVKHQNQLVAFIVHGINDWKGNKTAFNAGTGVIPPHRGNGLVTLMYQQAIKELKANGVHQSCLEVIQENEKAIHLYQKAGFQIDRGLHCYNGQLQLEKKFNWEVKEEHYDYLDIPYLQSFEGIRPAWEMNWNAIKHKKDVLTFSTIIINQKVQAYLAYEANGSIMQFAVQPAYKSKGLGYTLFQNLSTKVDKIKVNNVDTNDTSTNKFLNSIGLQNVINQFEMSATF